MTQKRSLGPSILYCSGDEPRLMAYYFSLCVFLPHTAFQFFSQIPSILHQTILQSSAKTEPSKKHLVTVSLNKILQLVI